MGLVDLDELLLVALRVLVSAFAVEDHVVAAAGRDDGGALPVGLGVAGGGDGFARMPVQGLDGLLGELQACRGVDHGAEEEEQLIGGHLGACAELDGAGGLVLLGRAELLLGSGFAGTVGDDVAHVAADGPKVLGVGLHAVGQVMLSQEQRPPGEAVLPAMILEVPLLVRAEVEVAGGVLVVVERRTEGLRVAVRPTVVGHVGSQPEELDQDVEALVGPLEDVVFC